MGRGVTPQSFVTIFCQRVRQLVEDSGYDNKQLASMMGVEVDTMRRYQTRLLMPHHLLHRFCEIMNVKTDYLLKEPPVTIEGTVVKPAIAQRKAARLTGTRGQTQG